MSILKKNRNMLIIFFLEAFLIAQFNDPDVILEYSGIINT